MSLTSRPKWPRERGTHHAIGRGLLTGVAVATAAAALTTPALTTSARAAEPAIQATDRAVVGSPRAAGIIVKTTSGTSAATLRHIARTAAGRTDTSVSATNTGAVGTQVIAFKRPVSNAAAQRAATAVAKRSDVEWAVPDTIVSAEATYRPAVSVNDPLFAKQFNLWDNTRAGGGYSLKAPSLWRSTTGKSVVVAVIDTGILAGHPDLAGQTVPGYDFISNATLARDGSGRDANPTDTGDWERAGSCGGGEPKRFQRSSWHGTHVAGIIAAATNNGRGIAGVAPTAKVQPIRALGTCGGSTSDILAAITWASGGHVAGVPDNPTPAKVINLSLGVAMPASVVGTACQAWSSVANAARARGATLVAAAGNDSWVNRFSASRSVPGACGGYITVGSVSRTGHRAFYSNYGSAVDLSAPGGDSVFDAHFLGTRFGAVASTVDSGTTTATSSYTYARYEGTSMAAPQVAAAAALVYSLGVRGSSNIANVLMGSTTPFAPARTRTVDWAHIRTNKGTFNLYCAPHQCGTGALNLGKIPAPIGSSRLVGSSTVGSRLTAHSSWTRAVALTVRWYVDGKHVATGSSYQIRSSDVGKAIFARTTPSHAPYTQIRTTTPSIIARS